MADNSTVFGVEVDAGAIAQAKSRLESIKSEIGNLNAEFLKGEKSASEFRSELSKLEKEAKTLNKALDSLETPRKMQVTPPSGIDVANDRFDRVSRDVGLAGDVGSNLRTVGGAVGAFGGGAIESTVSSLAEIPDVIEALPRLKESFAGMPQVLGKASASLGIPGGTAGLLGAMGGVAVVVGAGMLAFNEYAKRAELAREAQRAYNESLGEAIRLMESGGTSEDVQSQREELEENTRVVRETYQALKDLRQARNEENNIIEDVFTMSRVLAGGTRKELNEAINDANSSINQAEMALEAFNATIDENAIAANDAKKAEEGLARARTEALLDEARTAGDLARARLEAEDLDREAIDQRIQAINDNRQILEAELAVLRASGDTSEEVTKRIKDLTGQISLLGQQAEIFNQARTTATVREAPEAETIKQAEDEREEAISRETKLAEGLADAHQEYGDSLADLQIKLLQSMQDIRTQFQDSLTELATKVRDKLIDLGIQTSRSLRDAVRDANRSFEDAIAEGDFLGLVKIATDARRKNEDIRQAETDAYEDLKTERSRSLRDLKTDNNRRLRDLETSTQREEEALNRSYERRLQDLGGFTTQYESQMSQMYQNVLNQGNGGTNTGQRRTRRRSGNFGTGVSTLSLSLYGRGT